MGSVDISVLGVPKKHVDHVDRATRKSDACSEGEDQNDSHVEKRETVEIVDSDASNSPVKDDGVFSAVHVENMEPVEIVDSDASNGPVNGDVEDSEIRVEERENL